MRDELESAVGIRRENQELIGLGKARRAHIRTDRSGWGVGIIEEMTGLPVTGGRFACDFARSPAGVSGMQLEVSALQFYEDNCVECPDHSPGGRIPNLRTWAEKLIDERSQRQTAEAEAEHLAGEERMHRMAERTRLGARLSAACQEAIEAVNRLDTDASDRTAADSL